MTFWPLTSYSDFPTDQTFHQFNDLDTGLDFQRITSGFHGSFATGVPSQQGTLTLSDAWFRPPIFGLACAPIVDTRFLELAMALLDFSPRIPLGIFSILLNVCHLLLMCFEKRQPIRKIPGTKLLASKDIHWPIYFNWTICFCKNL